MLFTKPRTNTRRKQKKVCPNRSIFGWDIKDFPKLVPAFPFCFPFLLPYWLLSRPQNLHVLISRLFIHRFGWFFFVFFILMSYIYLYPELHLGMYIFFKKTDYLKKLTLKKKAWFKIFILVRCHWMLVEFDT